MENENNDVVADATVSSSETPAVADLIKNLKAEMNRKFSKINEQLQRVPTQEVYQPKRSVEDTSINVPADAKQYIDARLSEVEQNDVKKAQKSAWDKALELFPELNPDSDDHDSEFYKVADRIYSEFDLTKSKDAPLIAAKQAALELGKIEKLTKEKLLKDEARRSRIIAEGGSSPRETRKEKEPSLNAAALARIGVDPDKLKARIKAMKDQGE